MKKISEMNFVVIGGGTGLPSILKGLRKYTKKLTAIVAATDSGRSSGMLRNEFDIIPPGDIRNCLVALSDSEKIMSDLLQYRFKEGSLEGHSFGNLLITALSKVSNGFENAINELGKILKIKGKVFPSTYDNVHINAELEDGNIIEKESNIVDDKNNYVHLRPKVKKVFLSKKVKACDNAIEALQAADVIIFAPGCLFTSIITNLLVTEIRNAILLSDAKIFYVCNVMTQPSQTHGFDAADHIEKIIEYLGMDILDYVIVNNKSPPQEILQKYQKENADMVVVNEEKLAKYNGKVIKADLIEDVKNIEILWNKKNLLRHDSSKVTNIIIDTLSKIQKP